VAVSKIDSSKFYYCEKSENFHCCFSHKAKEPTVKNGLDTSQTKAANLAG
jgi:hypothetical protein